MFNGWMFFTTHHSAGQTEWLLLYVVAAAPIFAECLPGECPFGSLWPLQLCWDFHRLTTLLLQECTTGRLIFFFFICRIKMWSPLFFDWHGHFFGLSCWYPLCSLLNRVDYFGAWLWCCLFIVALWVDFTFAAVEAIFVIYLWFCSILLWQWCVCLCIHLYHCWLGTHDINIMFVNSGFGQGIFPPYHKYCCISLKTLFFKCKWWFQLNFWSPFSCVFEIQKTSSTAS